MADRHRLPALRHDAGKARHDEELECVADLLHVPADHPGHAADAIGRGQLCARVCPVGHRRMVLHVYRHRVRGVPIHFPLPARPPEVREQAGVAGEPRVQLPVQQHDPAGCVLYGAMGHAVPGAQRVRAGLQGYGRAAVLQPREHPHWAVSALPYRHWPAAGVAVHLAAIHPAQLYSAHHRHGRNRAGPDDLRHASVERWRRHAVHPVLAGCVHAGGGRDYRHCGGVPARRQRGAYADGQEYRRVYRCC